MRDQQDQGRAREPSDAAALDSAQRQIPSLEASMARAKAQLLSAEATVRQSQIDLDHTIVRSSIDGRIGDNSVRVGQFVQPGTRLMSVVPIGKLYVTANFKENHHDDHPDATLNDWIAIAAGSIDCSLSEGAYARPALADRL